MPGFNINGSGGEQGGAPNSLSEVRRTHRWIYDVLGIGSWKDGVRLVLKSCSRPSMQFEEPAMHHNQEQVYYAGKHTWDASTLTFYDVEQDPDVSAAMYDWVQSVLTIARANVAPPRAYKRFAQLSMVDGVGDVTESWRMLNTWPQATNWNSLDYSSSDLQTIEVKMRFDRAERVR
jgi:hypothetical protein